MSVKTQSFMFYTVCNQQNTMTQRFHLTQQTHSQGNISTIVQSPQFNTMLFWFSHIVIDYAMQPQAYTIEQI
jgi:hypothetical protein